ncbi:hypothetical protein [Treponema sp. R6D11]
MGVNYNIINHGTTKNGVSDDNGVVRMENMPSGKMRIYLKNNN